MSWLKKVLHFFTPLSSAELPNPFKERVETVRARDTKGKYVADDPSTPDVNEAYKNVPKKKRGRPSKKNNVCVMKKEQKHHDRIVAWSAMDF